MDLHRLRVVGFDTLVSEKEGEKENIAKLQEEYLQEEFKNVSPDIKKDETNELGMDKKCSGDSTSPSGSSKKSSFIRRKSKSEIFKIPSKNKLKKHELKNNSSFEDFSKPYKDSAQSNQKKRSLNLFKRKSAVHGEIQKEKGERKKKEEINYLFARETPSFIGYCKKCSNNAVSQKNQEFKLSNDIFGFQKNKRAVDPYLYQMSCHYLNIDKFPLKKFRKGFRRKVKPPQPVKLHRCKHHAMRVLNSRIGSSGGNMNTASMYHLNTRCHPRRMHPRRENSCYEENGRRNNPSSNAKDQNVAVTPSCLIPITKCRCDACVGSSTVELSLRSIRRPPCAPNDASSSHHKPPYSRHQKPCLQHRTPSPSYVGNAPVQNIPLIASYTKNQSVKVGSIVNNQRSRALSGLIQNVTSFHIKTRPSGKSCIKYAFFGLLIVVWSPCLLAVILAWVVMCPVRLTNILTNDKTKKPASFVNAFMNRFRKKGPGSEYQRMRCGHCSRQKNKNIVSSVASWYARTAGTVVNSFNTMISMLKIRNSTPSCAQSSFLKSSHPNPKKRYTLFYADNRGWMMKPARHSNTRSCVSTRVMRCEFKPKFWQTSNPEQKDRKAQTPNTTYEYPCPVHGYHYVNNNMTRQQSSPAGDAFPMLTNEVPECVCPNILPSYSGNRFSRPRLSTVRKYKKASLRCQQPCQQVNITSKEHYPIPEFVSNSTQYQTVKANPTKMYSARNAGISHKEYNKYHPDQLKYGILPFGMVLDYPCGTKHPVIANREAFRTHTFGLAGKTLNMSPKYTSSYNIRSIKQQSTKRKHQTSKSDKKSLGTHRSGFTDVRRIMQSKTPPSYRSNRSQEQSTINLTDRKSPNTHKTDVTKFKTHRYGFSDIKKCLQSKFATSSKSNSSHRQSVIKDIALNCPCKSKYELSITDRKSLGTQKTDVVKQNKTQRRNSIGQKIAQTRNKSLSADLSQSMLTKQEVTSTHKTDFTDKSQIMSKHRFKKMVLDLADKSLNMSKQTLRKKIIELADKTPSISEYSVGQKVNAIQKSSFITKCACTGNKIILKCPCGSKKISECFCKRKPSITKLVSQKSSPLQKMTIDCACETEKQQIKIDKAVSAHKTDLVKASVSSEITIKCSCKYQRSPTKIPPKQSSLNKMLADFSSNTEKQQNTGNRESLSSKKGLNEPSAKKMVECGCGSDKFVTEDVCPCPYARPPSSRLNLKNAFKNKPQSALLHHPLSQPVQPSQFPRMEKPTQCTCWAKKQSTTQEETVSLEKAAKLCSPSTCKNDFKYKPRSALSEHPLSRPSRVKTSQFPRMEKAVQCPCCRNEPSPTSSEISSDQRVTKSTSKYTTTRETVDCGCGTEKQPSTTVAIPPTKDRADAAKKQSITQEKTVSSEKATKLCSPSTCKNDFKYKPRSALFEHPLSRPSRVKTSQFPRMEKAAQCPCCRNEPSPTSSEISSDQRVTKSTSKYTTTRETVDCGCGTEKQPSTTVAIPRTKERADAAKKQSITQEETVSSEKATKLCSPSTCKNDFKYKPRSALFEHPLSRPSRVKTSQFPRMEKAAQCPCCINESSPTTSEISSDQRVTKSTSKYTTTRETVDCGCGTEKQPSTTVAIPPTKDRADAAKKQPPPVEPAVECTCKDAKSITRETIPPKKSVSKKITIDCGCGPERQPSTTAAIPPTKPRIDAAKKQVPPVQPAVECACKDAKSITRETIPPKQSVPKKITTDCGCGPERQPSTTEAIPPTKPRADTAKKQVPPVQPEVECTCKDAKSIIRETVPPKQTVSKKITVDTDTAKKQVPPVQPEVECTCKDAKSIIRETVPPKQTVSKKITVECGCGTERKPSTTAKKQTKVPKKKSLPVKKESRSICGCTSEKATTYSPKPSAISKTPVECQCCSEKKKMTRDKQTQYENKCCPCLKKKLAKQSLIRPKKQCTLQKFHSISPKMEDKEQSMNTTHSISQKNMELDSSDYRPRNISLKYPSSLNKINPERPYRSSLEPPASKLMSQNQSTLFGIASDCTCDTIGIDKKYTQYQTSGIPSEKKKSSIEYSTGKQLKSTLKQSPKFRITFDRASQYEPDETEKAVSRTLQKQYQKQSQLFGIASDCSCTMYIPITADIRSFQREPTKFGVTADRASQYMTIATKSYPLRKQAGIGYDCVSKTCQPRGVKNDQECLHTRETCFLEHPAEQTEASGTQNHTSFKQTSTANICSLPFYQPKTSANNNNNKQQQLKKPLKSSKKPCHISQKQLTTSQYHRKSDLTKRSPSKFVKSLQTPVNTSQKPSKTQQRRLRKTDLLKCTSSRDYNSSQTQLQMSQRKNLVKIDSDSRQHVGHNERKHASKTCTDEFTSSEKVKYIKCPLLRRVSKCVCRREQCLSSSKKRPIDCVCRTKWQVSMRSRRHSTSQHLNTPPCKNNPLSTMNVKSRHQDNKCACKTKLKQSSSLKLAHMCNCSVDKLSFPSSHSRKSVIMKKSQSVLPRRANILPKYPSSRISSLHSDCCCSFIRLQSASLKAFDRSRETVVANKSQSRSFGRTRKKRSQTLKHQSLLSPDCNCLHDDSEMVDKKIKKTRSQICCHDAKESSISHDCDCLVNPPPPPSKISHQSSKTSRLMMKLFRCKISKQPKVPEQSNIPAAVSTTKCKPCTVDNNTNTQLHLADKSNQFHTQAATKYSQTYRGQSFSSCSKHTKCLCLTNKPHSSQCIADKKSCQNRKLMLRNKSHSSSFRRRQLPKISQRPSFPVYASHSRCCPFYRTSSKFSSDKSLIYEHKPIAVDKSYSYLPGCSISGLSKKSQRSSFPSYLSPMESYRIGKKTASSKLSLRKPSYYSRNSIEGQFYPRHTQRSQQSKSSHNLSIVMAITPVQCKCSSEESLKENQQKSNRNKSQPKQERHSNQCHKKSKCSPRRSQPTPSETPQNLDTQWHRKRYSKLSHYSSDDDIPTISGEKQVLSSGPMSYNPRKITTRTERKHEFAEQQRQQLAMSKYSHHFNSQLTSSAEQQRLQELIKLPMEPFQPVPVLPGRCRCPEKQRLKLFEHPRKSASRQNFPDKQRLQSTMGTEGQPRLSAHLPSQQPKMSKYSRQFSSQPTPSTDGQQLQSDQKSYHPSQMSKRTNQRSEFLEHLPSQQPEVSKYSRQFSSQPTSSTNRQRLESDPMSYKPRKMTGTELQPEFSERLPSQQPEMSKYSRQLSSQPTHSTNRQRLQSDPMSFKSRKMTGTELQPEFSSHLPSEQHEMSKYSRQLSSKPTPLNDRQQRQSTMGTEGQPRLPAHLPSQQPKMSKYSRQFSSQPTPSTDGQQLQSDQISYHPSQMSIRTNRRSEFLEHPQSQQREVSKYSRQFSSQPTSSTNRQRLESDPMSYQPRKMTGIEMQPEFSEHLPSQQPEMSQYSRQLSSQRAPSTDRQQLQPDPMSYHPSKMTTGTNWRPESLEHLSSQPKISKYSRQLSSQRTPSNDSQRLQRKTSLEEAQFGILKHIPSQEAKKSKLSTFLRRISNKLSNSRHEEEEMSSSKIESSKYLSRTYKQQKLSQHLRKSASGLSPYDDSSQLTPAMEKRLQSDAVSYHPRKKTTGTDWRSDSPENFPNQQPERLRPISKISKLKSDKSKCGCVIKNLHKLSEKLSQHSRKSRSGTSLYDDSPQFTPAIEKQRLQSDPMSYHPRKKTTGTDWRPEFSENLPTQQRELSKYSRQFSFQPTHSTDKQRLQSDPVSYHPSKMTTGTNWRPEFSEHLPSQQPEVSKYSRQFKSQPTTSTDRQRFQSDPISYQPRKMTTRTEIQPEFSGHLPSQQPEVSKYSRQFNSQPTTSTDRQRFQSDPISYHPSKMSTGTNWRPEFSEHLPSQQPEVSKYSRQFNSQPTTSTDRQRFQSDPMSYEPRKMTTGTKIQPEFSGHLPSQQPEVSKYSRQLSSQPTSSTDGQQLQSDPISYHPSKMSTGTNWRPDISEHLPSQQREVPKYSRQLSSQPTPSTDGQQLQSDPISYHPSKMSTGTNWRPEFSKHLPSQQPEVSKYSRQLSSQPTPSTDGQQLQSDPISYHPSKINTGTNWRPEFSEHLPSQQPEVSKYSRQLSSQPTSSTDRQRLQSDPMSYQPRKMTTETEVQPEPSDHLPSQQSEPSKYSRQFSSQPTPLTDRQRLQSDPMSYQPRKRMTGTELQPEFLEHLPSQHTDISKPSSLIRHSLSQQQEMTTSPHSLDPLQKIPIIPGKCSCSEQPYSEHLHKTEADMESERQNIDLQRLSSRQNSLHSLSFESTPSAEKLRLLSKQNVEQHELPPHLLNQHPGISQYSRDFSSHPTPSQYTRKTMTGTDVQADFPNRLSSQQSDITQSSLPLRTSQPTQIISRLCTSYAKKIRLSPKYTSNYAYKTGQTEKTFPGLSQYITIHRSEVSQSPPSSLQFKEMTTVYPRERDYTIKYSQQSPDNICPTSPVDKPPPGLLQHHSSDQMHPVRKWSTESGLRQQQIFQSAVIPQQPHYPDFNRVSMRYPGNITGPVQSENNSAPKQAEHIPYPANYYYQSPAGGVTPTPNYARYPCFINPANKCGPKTCNDEFALRRAYQRRPLRYTPPQQQSPKTTKQQKKDKKAEKKKKKEEKAMKKKEEAMKKKEKAIKTKNKKSGGKSENFCECVRHLVNDAEKEAWPTDVSCRPMYIQAMKRKPCFWIYECCPSMYPAFLNFYKFQENICQMCMYILSICFWCPLIFCVYFCCSVICGSE